jgi:hypothetical protein
MSYVGWKVIKDPDTIFLISEGNAKWIRFGEPTKLKIRHKEKISASFSVDFKSGRLNKDNKIFFRVFHNASFWIDNVLIYKTSDSNLQWKKTKNIKLGQSFEQGIHTLQVDVESDRSHPSLLLYSKDLNLVSGKWWKVTTDGKNWKEATESSQIIPNPISRMFDRVDKIFFSNIFLYTSIFFFAFFLVLASEKGRLPAFIRPSYFSASNIRFLMIIAWTVLCLKNILVIPMNMGMDFKGHIDYITTVASGFHLPYATDGWQMFQPPFYYIISAFLLKVFLQITSFDIAVKLLRIIPMICGILQIEVCYRVMRLMYPKNNTLQTFGTVIGGFIPMNIYISQAIGNEPLAGILTSLLVLWQIKYIQSERPPSRGQLIIAGFLAGLALLTKTSALLIIILLVLTILLKGFFNMGNRNNQITETTRSIITISITAFLVCGWYYIRNIIVLGAPFIGGWDSARKIVWWQDPGFRTIEQFTNFGECLLYPIFSSFAGVWDSLYSTIWMDGFISVYNLAPWNYNFMLSLSWLSLPLTLFLIIGFLIITVDMKRSCQDGRLFCVISIFLYLSAILYMFLTVPIFSTGKATYALGLLPCIAVVCTEGAKPFLKTPVLKSMIAGIVVVWVVCSYCSFFVIEILEALPI